MGVKKLWSEGAGGPLSKYLFVRLENCCAGDILGRMKYCENIIDAIGDTPLVRLQKITGGSEALVLGKMEGFNPGGSAKDRIAVKMIDAAEREGLLKPGGTIVEPTSGNTGSGLAMVAALRGYKLIFTMPDKMSMEKEITLRAYGAEVVRTPTAVEPEDPRSYYKVAERIVSEHEGAFSPSQYWNQNNPQAHFETTGPEIWRDTGGRVTHFVVGLGTGGTMTGVARYLREQGSAAKIIGVDPEGSVYHHQFHNDKGDIHVYKTEGIGEDFMPTTIDLSLVDDIVVIDDREAFAMTRRLAVEEGILVGSSGGAAMAGALRVIEPLGRDAVVVVLFPDTGKNYLSTAFNDKWLQENGLNE